MPCLFFICCVCVHGPILTSSLLLGMCVRAFVYLFSFDLAAGPILTSSLLMSCSKTLPVSFFSLSSLNFFYSFFQRLLSSYLFIIILAFSPLWDNRNWLDSKGCFECENNV